MKQIKAVISCVVIVTLIFAACKKKDNNSNSSTSSNSTTTGTTTGGNTTSYSSLSVNGQDQGNIILGVKGAVSSPPIYEYILANTNSANWYYTIFFGGNSAPASGNYVVEDSTDHVPVGKCYILFQKASPTTQAIGHSGSITVNSDNTITFTNIIANQMYPVTASPTTYTMSGKVK